MTLRVCIINENGILRPARAHRYTGGDTDQTLVFHERHDPAEESDVRDREVVSLVAPCWGARKGESPLLRSWVGVAEPLKAGRDHRDPHPQLCWR